MPRIASRAVLGASVGLSALLVTAPAAAQSVPGALPSREQVEVPRAQDPRPSGVEVRDETPRATQCPFADSPLEVAIDRLLFVQPDGSALPGDALATLAGVTPLPGPRKLVQLCELRDAAAGALSRAGYVAGVTIPPQEITDGEARLTVILARLVDVTIVGSAGPHQRTLEARVRRLKDLPALNTREVEAILLGANSVPGLNVTLALRSAGTRPGEVVGELRVSHTPFLLLANAQNSGSRVLGRESGSLRAEYYGLTGLSDRTFIGVSSTLDFQEQQVFQFGHYLATDRGVSIGGRFSYAWSRPDIGALDLRSRSLIGGLDFSVPITRSVRTTADLGGGFELIEQRVKLHTGAGALAVTKDKLRVGFARAAVRTRAPQFTGPDRWGLGASVELRQGFDLFDATKTATITPAGYTPSRFDGSATATVLRGGVDGFVSITPAFSLGAMVQGQWSSGALLSFEEFSVGNLTLGRGYDPGVTGGDQAIGARIEPRLQLPIKSPRFGAQAFAFYDIVNIWNDDAFTTENDRRLRSWGGGVRASLAGLMSLEALYAHPEDPELRLPGAPRASDRFLLSLTVQFAPRR